MNEIEIVWLTEERTFAFLTQLGAYYSTVKFIRKGIEYEIDIANDEWEWHEWRVWPNDDDKD